MATPAARAITSSPAKRAHARAPSFGAASASSAPSVTTGIGPVDGLSSAGAAGTGTRPRPRSSTGRRSSARRRSSSRRSGSPRGASAGGPPAARPPVGDTAVLADGDVGHATVGGTPVVGPPIARAAVGQAPVLGPALLRPADRTGRLSRRARHVGLARRAHPGDRRRRGLGRPGGGGRGGGDAQVARPPSVGAAGHPPGVAARRFRLGPPLPDAGVVGV